MKIISKYSDYYDSGIAYGVDEKLRFNRKQIEVDETLRIFPPQVINTRKKGKNLRAVLYFKLLGFCGEMYPLVHVVIENVTQKNKQPVYHKRVEFYIYDYQQLEMYMAKHIIPLKEVNNHKLFSGYYYSRYAWSLDLRVKEFFERKYLNAKLFFTKYQVPYFLLEEFVEKKKNGYDQARFKNTLLPTLKDIKFVQVKAPIEAFQEISMFLGSLRTNEDDTVMIGDKYLAQAKGFDCYSFKKEPEKKTRKKC